MELEDQSPLARRLTAGFQASPFDGDLAEMDAAGLVTEGVGQLIEGEAMLSRTGRSPDCSSAAT
jgi:hypothetical protein